MMASSQVEMASSSPFGCVLRDRNHRDGCRESNVKATHAALQRNIKNFVMDHLNTCISMSSDSPTNENENDASSWVSNASNKNNNNNLRNLRFTRIKHGNNSNKEKDESSLASLISPRHSRLLDRWAASQARAMVSTLEDEVQLLSMDDDNTTNNNNNNNDTLGRTSSSSSSDDASSEISSLPSSLGASSLVQIWEKRFNQGNGSRANTPVTNGRASPNATFTNNCDNNALSSSSSGEEAQCRRLEAGESCNEPPPAAAVSANEESFSFPDWESQSDQSFSPQGRWSSAEAADGDRVSVADIIRRLTSPNHAQGPPPTLGDENDNEGFGNSLTSSPCRDIAPENSEQRAFPQVTSTPRIRGRKAFNDLLMQLERDLHGELTNLEERRAVSRFAQRGRIQSLLRLKLLQRGVAANDQSRQKSTLARENRQPHESAIMQLRERFSAGVENRTTVQAEVACPRSSPVEIVNNTISLENSPAANQPSNDTLSQTVQGTADNSTESTWILMPQTNANHDKERAHPSSHVTLQETCLEVQQEDLQETAKATPSTPDSNLNEIENKAETSNQETVEEEEARDQHYAESSYDDMVEEVEAMDLSYDETSYDWISEISRPRSYWEERRQAWYKEMLDTQNEDMRKLLERRTVSNFLSSNFRETMDRLMETHRGTQTQLINSQDDEEDNQGLMAILQERVRSASTPQEDGREIRQEEEGDERRNEEEENLEEPEPDPLQELELELESESELEPEPERYAPSPSPSRIWSYRDNETGDDFDRVESTSSSQPSQSLSFCQNSRPYSSSTNHHSIEMELIYDMRAQMELLYHEMSELRKSIKSCMDMQMQFQQQSMNQEAHTVKKEEKKSQNQVPKKGNCCICYDMKVDALLYRCGHMCACLKCANELQWSGGKCPICRAKIVDVVRVYVDA